MTTAELKARAALESALRVIAAHGLRLVVQSDGKAVEVTEYNTGFVTAEAPNPGR